MVVAAQVKEYALLAACTCQLIVNGYLPPAAPSLAIASVVVVMIALLLHEARGEMWTLYTGVIPYNGYIAATVLSESDILNVSWWSYLYWLAVVGVALAWLSSWLFPWPDFSHLHGPYETIGCRTKRYGGVECRVFYPAVILGKTSQRVRYALHGQHLAKGLSVFSGIPAWVFHNFINGELAAWKDAPVAKPPQQGEEEKKNGWPVVIYSHGLAGSVEMYSHINQQLASQGHIVVMLGHCDGSASVTSPEDGKIEYYHKITPEIRDDIDGAGYRFRHSQLLRRVKEVRDLLDAIHEEHAKKLPGDVFEFADLTNVSIAGHSFGAATALTAAHEDERFQTAVLLDAWMEPLGDHARSGLGSRVPVFHLLSEHFYNWKPNYEDVKQHIAGCTHEASKLLVIRRARHNNFSDMSIFSPNVNRWAKSAGKIDHLEALRIVGQLSAAFLKGEALMSLVAQFPDVVSIEEE